MFLLKFILNFVFCLLILSFPINENKSVFHLFDEVLKPHKAGIYQFISKQTKALTNKASDVVQNSVPNVKKLKDSHMDKVKNTFSASSKKPRTRSKVVSGPDKEEQLDTYTTEEQAMLKKVLADFENN